MVGATVELGLHRRAPDVLGWDGGGAIFDAGTWNMAPPARRGDLAADDDKPAERLPDGYRLSR